MKLCEQLLRLRVHKRKANPKGHFVQLRSHLDDVCIVDFVMCHNRNHHVKNSSLFDRISFQFRASSRTSFACTFFLSQCVPTTQTRRAPPSIAFVVTSRCKFLFFMHVSMKLCMSRLAVPHARTTPRET